MITTNLSLVRKTVDAFSMQVSIASMKTRDELMNSLVQLMKTELRHDGGAPKGWGLIYKGRLVCFYSFDTDLGDGWEDYDVHRDPPEKHQAALQMGANLIQYVFTNNPVAP